MGWSTNRPSRSIPRRREDPPGGEPEHGAGGHPGDDVGGVVDADVGPAGGDDGGQRSTTPGRVRRPSHPVSRSAVNAAALAWPDGNDDVSGRRTG